MTRAPGYVGLVALLVASTADCGRDRASAGRQEGDDAGVPTGDGPSRDDLGTPTPGDGPSSTLDPGVAVSPTLPAARSAALTQARAALSADAPDSAASFASLWKPTYLSTLGYDPMQAQGLDLLSGSHIALNAGELAMLGRQGFVISGRQAFPTFFYGYKAIYADHLPVFISADSILYAVHRSYDAILKHVETAALVSDLEGLLRGMHAALGAGTGSALAANVRADADLYLAVARRLLRPVPLFGSAPVETIVPVAGADQNQVTMIVDKALGASGLVALALFGDPDRVIDFSQFKPRGHYAGDPQLEAYFRAMMWLGRTDLRVIVDQRFFRRQFDVSLLLALLLDDARRSSWQRIDETLRGFVGESDNMTVLDFERLRTVLALPNLAALAQRSDQELAQATTDAGLGIQRIASQILFVPPAGLNAPLDRVFLFFGQRYILDSEVLSNVVFDRVLPDGGAPRMMPDPLDVAFAALGNTHAAPLLASDLRTHKNYPTALHKARRLMEAHEPGFWNGSLYHAWLGALRAMSPATDLAAPAAMAWPAVARTEAWSRRVMNTQLASWAELRHDTLLYAKQSYTGFPTCEFPDAYVDPYPDLWAALAEYAARGIALVGTLPVTTQSKAATHFAELQTVAQRLKDMAQRQLIGEAFTADQLAWVNEAVNIKEVPNCGAPLQVPDGWYVRLFYDSEDAKKTDPTIADVHTQPADEAGDIVGKVLHVGTGNPRLMVVTAETCVGPRVYAGLASSYYEKVTGNFQRLTDVEWLDELKSAPPDVAWMQDLIAR